MTTMQQPTAADFDFDPLSCDTARGFKNVADYQEAAQQAIFDSKRQPLLPWAWVTPACGTHGCINADHLFAQAAKKIHYPYGVCVYCGLPAGARDHILPRPFTGTAQRQRVITVPSCGQCNSMISDSPAYSITERRNIAHSKIEKKYRRCLRLERRTAEELDEFGPLIRSSIERAEQVKSQVLSRLRWPSDAAYDLRAMDHSGIDDPYAAGLLTPNARDYASWVS